MQMMAWKVVVRSITLVAAVCCLAGIGAGSASAQGVSVAVSPLDLTFGVPKSAPPQVLVSAQQFVTVAISGTGSATFSSSSIAISGSGDFVITSNACVGTFTAPFACQVGVTFTSGQPAGVLETATLSVAPVGGPSAISVALNGALGAFELFPALNTNLSRFQGVTWPQSAGNPVNTASVALSCPASGISAVLSSSPDGVNNVFQDNTITVTNTIPPPPTAVQPTTVTVSNVCYGGDTNFQGFTGFPPGTTNCFLAPYEGAAAGLLGSNPDVTQFDDSTFLGSFGVQPLDLMNNPGNPNPDSESQSFLPILVPGPQTLTVTLLDAGGDLGSAALHLVSNCTASGVTTGGTVVAPPVDPNNPASLVPAFPFNNTNGQHIQFDANYLNSKNTTNFGDNTTTPQVADTLVTQSSFPALVQGTSAGPSVCMRFNGELDGNGNPQCKAFTITCTVDNTGTATGTNCPQSTVRNVLFKAVFDSIDTPTSQRQIAIGTGPGFLMGTDSWASSNTTCTFEAGGPLANQLCPQDTLTEFIGGDPGAGGTARSTNSTFIVVQNMPLPFTIPTVKSANFLSCLLPGILPCWQKSTTVSLKFFASPAIYPFFNPLPANGFVAARIQTVTLGTNPATAMPAVPDTTYPVPGDQVLSNPGTCPLMVPGGIFAPSTTLTADTSTGQPFAEGRYILHYFATDCAATEELNFTFKSSTTANWASFKTVQLNIDMTPPTINVTNESVNTTSKGGTVKLTFSCSDPTLHDAANSLGSGVVTCGPFLFFAPANTGSVTSTFKVKTKTGSIALTATDLAGNSFTTNVPF
jgi:hypothetical protein